jgi:hypothetical protein
MISAGSPRKRGARTARLHALALLCSCLLPALARADPSPQAQPANVLGPLAVTTGLCGAAVAATYFTRDQPLSRGLSIASGAVGGTVTGAVVGYSLATSGGGDGGGAILKLGLGLFGGALLGAVGGTLVASHTSRDPGAPRVATTAISLSPIVIGAIVAAVVEWK